MSRFPKLMQLDHLVLTVADLDKTCAFYTQFLGCEVITFGEGRKALRFGNQKINLHLAGHEFEPKALQPTPGSADLCFLVDQPVAEAKVALEAGGLTIEEGPVARTGATGPLLSIYLRDPDNNLIELSNVGGLSGHGG